MKILMALQGLDIGGAETHVVELSKEMKRRGYDIIMVSGGGVYEKEVAECGIKHYTVPIKERDYLKMIKATGMLKKIIDMEKPDLVHSHARIPSFLLGRIHNKNKYAFTFVTTAHWTFDISPILKRMTHWGDKTLAVSDDIKKYLLDNYNISENNIFVSINGIDSRKFSKDINGEEFLKEFSLDENAKRITYVSRLNPAVCKPAYYLIKEFENINKAIPGIELIIVGDGACYGDMLSKVSEVNERLKRTAIILTGPRIDINKIHSTADICVGVSRAILEPMCMEKPCVIAGQEGYIGILDSNKLDMAIKCNFTCRGCDELDAGILRDDVIKLLTMESELLSEVIDFGKSVVENHYSIKRMADDNENMYKCAIKEFKNDIAILGYYGYGNRGDDALLGAIVRDLSEVDETLNCVALSYRPEETKKEYGINSIGRFNINQIKKLFNRVSLFILGGGSLIQDVTSTKSLIYYLYIIKLAKKNNLPVMLYANGIGPINGKANRKRVMKVLNTVDLITLRDESSLELLKEMGVTNPKMLVVADPTFNMDKCDEKKASDTLMRYGIKNGEKYACFSVRRWKNTPFNIEHQFAALADYISEKYSLVPVFIPMQHGKDVPVGSAIRRHIKSKSVFIEEELSLGEILGIIKSSEISVGVRLHMLIFATLLGVPVLGIEYDPKIKSFQEFVGQPYTMQPEMVFDGKYKESIDNFMNNRESIKSNILQVIPKIKEQSKLSAVEAIKLIK